MAAVSLPLVLALRSGRARRRRREQLYAGFLRATVELVDETTQAHGPLARSGRIAMWSALLRVAEADRALRPVLLQSDADLERAVRALTDARGALAEAARHGFRPARAGEPVRRPLTCALCGVASAADARGWRAYVVGDDAVATCCPSCTRG